MPPAQIASLKTKYFKVKRLGHMIFRSQDSRPKVQGRDASWEKEAHRIAHAPLISMGNVRAFDFGLFYGFGVLTKPLHFTTFFPCPRFTCCTAAGCLSDCPLRQLRAAGPCWFVSLSLVSSKFRSLAVALCSAHWIMAGL